MQAIFPLPCITRAFSHVHFMNVTQSCFQPCFFDDAVRKKALHLLPNVPDLKQNKKNVKKNYCRERCSQIAFNWGNFFKEERVSHEFLTIPWDFEIGRMRVRKCPMKNVTGDPTPRNLLSCKLVTSPIIFNFSHDCTSSHSFVCTFSRHKKNRKVQRGNLQNDTDGFK